MLIVSPPFHYRTNYPIFTKCGINVGGHPELFFKFLLSVITRWWKQELLRWEKHKHEATLSPDRMNVCNFKYVRSAVVLVEITNGPFGIGVLDLVRR
jgi:hypothetical protein